MSRLSPTWSALLSAAVMTFSLGTAHATVFSFDTDPFAGTTALQTPGRQIVGNELFIPQIDLANDVFAVNGTVFGFGSSQVSLFNGLAANLQPVGNTVIVLQDLDAAGGRKPTGNVLAAGTAANLIANSGAASGPGLFVYFNSGLNLSRLVFGTDLGSTSSDLKILARFTGEVGQTGMDNLPRFSAGNFALTTEATAVPEPASIGLLLVGVTGLVLRRRKGRQGA